MAIIAKASTREWEPAPEGLHQAVCCDVVDLGEIATDWGIRPMVQIKWQIDYLREDTKPYLVQRRFTNSLHEKAALRHILESWRGKRFTDEELQGFDLEQLIGANGQIQIIHKQVADGRIFANVQAMLPLAKGMDKLKVADYIRVVDRIAQEAMGEDNEESPF